MSRKNYGIWFSKFCRLFYPFWLPFERSCSTHTLPTPSSCFFTSLAHYFPWPIRANVREKETKSEMIKHFCATVVIFYYFPKQSCQKMITPTHTISVRSNRCWPPFTLSLTLSLTLTFFFSLSFGLSQKCVGTKYVLSFRLCKGLKNYIPRVPRRTDIRLVLLLVGQNCEQTRKRSRTRVEHNKANPFLE